MKVIDYHNMIILIEVVLTHMNKIDNNNLLTLNKVSKHNPFEDPNVKSIEIKNDMLKLVYNDNNTQLLFNPNDTYRGFSFTDNLMNHVEHIKMQLMCAKNMLNLCIIKKIKYENGLHIIKKSKNKYYINVFPPCSFFTKNGDTKIANQYELKFENNKYQLYFNYHNLSKYCEGQSPLTINLIQKFNKNNKVNAHNYQVILKNISAQNFPFYIKDNSAIDTYHYYELKNIDDTEWSVKKIIMKI